MARLVCFIDREGYGTCDKKRSDCSKCDFPKKLDDRESYKVWDYKNNKEK